MDSRSGRRRERRGCRDARRRSPKACNARACCERRVEVVRRRSICVLVRPEASTRSVHEFIPVLFGRWLPIVMINVAGKWCRVGSFEINEANRRARVWKLAVSRKERKDVGFGSFFVDIACSVEVCSERIRVPKRAGAVFCQLRRRVVNKTDNGRQRLGEVDDWTEGIQLIDRHNADVRIIATSISKGDRLK
jgi:hypothetical protein